MAFAIKGKSPCSFSTKISPNTAFLAPDPQAAPLQGGRTTAGPHPAAVTYLHQILLEDPIKTQLAHGVDGLPLLGFLSSHQQVGDFCGRDWRSLRAQHPRSEFPDSQRLLSRGRGTRVQALAASVIQQVLTEQAHDSYPPGAHRVMTEPKLPNHQLNGKLQFVQLL